MKTVEINYPENFFDFSNGVDISNKDINNAIEKGVRELSEAEGGSFYTWKSGNTQVLLTKHGESKIIYVTVSKNYKENTIYL